MKTGEESDNAQRLGRIEKQLMSIAEETNALSKRLVALDERLTANERRVKTLAPPPDRISPTISRNVGITGLSPALRQTLIAIRELTEKGGWVTIEEIAGRTGRATTTESNYAKRLFEQRFIDRIPKLQETSPSRRTRIYQYRAR